MRRITILSCLALVGAACDGDIVLENARPMVTWVEVTPADEDTAALSLWLKDAEGDAVDVVAIWSAGSEGDTIALAPGSAPLKGLPTELGLDSAQGQLHRVTWDLSDVPAGSLTLTLTVDDRPRASSAGDTYRVTLDPRAATGPLPATLVTTRD